MNTSVKAPWHFGMKFSGKTEDWMAPDTEENLEYARDYLHAGPRGHTLVAEKMLKELTWP